MIINLFWYGFGHSEIQERPVHYCVEDWLLLAFQDFSKTVQTDTRTGTLDSSTNTCERTHTKVQL